MRPDNLDSVYRFLSRRGKLVRTIARKAGVRALRVLSRMRGFEVSADSSLADVHMLLGTYERGTVEVCKRILEPGMSVVDVGAHIGYYSRLFAQLVGSSGKVYSFEPHPENFAVLCRNLRYLRNVQAVPMAVADIDGELTLHESAVGTGTHSLAAERYPYLRRLTVQGVTLDRFFEDVSPTLVKIDVEGAELKVLKGAHRLLDRSPTMHLVLEFYPAILRQCGASPSELLNLLQSAGARIYVIGSESGELRSAEEWPSLDALASAVPKFVNLLAVKGFSKAVTV